MGFAAKIRGFMGFPEDEYYEEDEPADTLPGQALREEDEAPCTEVVVAHPERFDDASEIADHLAANRMIVLNMESTPRETARRLIDFLGGATYAKSGLLKRVAGNVYLITPYNVDYSEEETDVFGDGGFGTKF